MGLGAAGTAAVAAGAIGAAGSVGSSLIGSSAAKSAASQQSSAQQAAAANETGAISNIGQALAPYMEAGQTGANTINNALQNYAYQTGDQYLGAASNDYTAAGQALTTSNDYNTDAANIYGTLSGGISQQVLDNTPGYQFTLQQGLESTQNSAAARGLANSGAALKGAATYATGLADNTYQNQYNDLLGTASGFSGLANNEVGVANNFVGQGQGNAGLQADLLATNNQNFGQYLSGAQLGANAAGTYANADTNLTTGASGNIAGAGASTAAGTIGAGNSLTSGISGATGSISQSLLLSQLLQGTSGTGLGGLGGGMYSNSGWQ